MIKPLLRRLLPIVFLALCLAGPLTGCSSNPATGKMQLNLISESQEIQIGLSEGPKFLEQSGGELPDKAINDYVALVGKQMAMQSERPNLPWEFKVVDSAMINAFALPGGKVFISRGLLEKMETEAQLAGVLGHEIGHVTAQHANQRMSQAILATAAVIAVGASTDEDWAPYVAGGIAGITQLKFSRDQEIEADTLGMRYMTRAGHAPIGQLEVMQILKAASEGARPPELLSTHPHPESRIANVQQKLAGPYATFINNPDYTENRERFQNIVANRLPDLPPAQHGSAQAGDLTSEELFAQGNAHLWCGCGHAH